MPFSGQGFLQAGQFQDMNCYLQAGITTVIDIQSPDFAVFSLQLFDQNINKVDTDWGLGDAQCQVTPAWSGPFVLRITCHQGAGRFLLQIFP
jgi:hypothetical protein